MNNINANLNILPVKELNNYAKPQLKNPNFEQVPSNNSHPNKIAFYGQDLVNNQQTPKILTDMFEAIKDKKDEDLAETAYPYLVKYLGVEDTAPKGITWKEKEGRSIVSDYKVFDNSVVLYKDLFKNSSKPQQIAFIAHELTHCKQSTNIMRTEGLGIEKYAYANAVSDSRAAMVTNPKFISMMEKAKKAGKERELMQYLLHNATVENIAELKHAHPNIEKLPKIDANSKEGQKAQADLIAQFEYNGADMNAYNSSPLEKEALGTEKEIIQYYNRYCQA